MEENNQKGIGIAIFFIVILVFILGFLIVFGTTGMGKDKNKKKENTNAETKTDNNNENTESVDDGKYYIYAEPSDEEPVNGEIETFTDMRNYDFYNNVLIVELKIPKAFNIGKKVQLFSEWNSYVIKSGIFKNEWFINKKNTYADYLKLIYNVKEDGEELDTFKSIEINVYKENELKYEENKKEGWTSGVDFTKLEQKIINDYEVYVEKDDFGNECYIKYTSKDNNIYYVELNIANDLGEYSDIEKVLNEFDLKIYKLNEVK